MGDTRPPIEYLATSSKSSLESFQLSRLGQASNLRKEARQVLDEWIEAEVQARLARLILEGRRAENGASHSLAPDQAQPQRIEQLAMSFLPAIPHDLDDTDLALPVQVGVARQQDGAPASLPRANAATKKPPRARPKGSSIPKAQEHPSSHRRFDERSRVARMQFETRRGIGQRLLERLARCTLMPSPNPGTYKRESSPQTPRARTPNPNASLSHQTIRETKPERRPVCVFPRVRETQQHANQMDSHEYLSEAAAASPRVSAALRRPAGAAIFRFSESRVCRRAAAPAPPISEPFRQLAVCNGRPESAS